MIRIPAALSKAFVAAVFLGTVGFILRSLVEIPNWTGLSGSVHSASAGVAVPGRAPEGTADPSRPAEVGNAAAENFLRKVDRPSAVPARGLIRLEDETFSAAYDELYDHRAEYYGREIELAGVVVTQEGLRPGEFLIGRKLLWCCEYDMYFIGFLAYSNGSTPEEGDKIRVRGSLGPREYRDPETGKSFKVPAVEVERVFPEPDLSERVYPSPRF